MRELRVEEAPRPTTRIGALPGSWRSLELLAVLVLSVSVIGLIALRLGVFYAPQIWIAAFLVTYGYTKLAKPIEWSQSQDAPTWHLLLVLGVALSLRLPPFAYLLGGQDQGIYMNMAAELVRTGALMPVDPVLEGISNASARELYLQSNYQPDNYMPGIYSTEEGLRFQFYHLFPLWLAMFGALFGAESAGYALTFLSLVSLLFFQRLAHSISSSANAGLIAGLLLAINPLHTFFSKFTVTEIPTLAFSAMAFTYLLACINTQKGEGVRRYFVLSLLALGMIFMTRISGFLYLPFFLLLATVGQLAGQSDIRYLRVARWAIAVLGLYAASVLYGLEWSAPYAKDIYMFSFEPLLGARWRLWLTLIAVAGLGALILVIGLSWKPNIVRRLEKGLIGMWWLLPMMVVLFTTIAAWKAYQLGFNDTYSTHPRLSGLADRGIDSTRAVSLVASAFYLSPFMLIAFWIASFRKQAAPALTILLFFVVCFYGHIAVLQWFLPYQPYYARYLVSELVPYLILFVVCFWATLGEGRLRKLTSAALVLTGAYSLVLSTQQVGKSEHQGLAAELGRIASRFDQKDLVVIDRNLKSPHIVELKTPLIYVHGLRVLTAGLEDLRPQGFARRISRSYQDTYFITTDITAAPEGFVEVESLGFLERNYCRGVSLPVALCTRNDVRLMLFRLPLEGATVVEFAARDDRVRTLSGVKEGDWLRSSGNAGFVMYGPYVPLSAGQYTLLVEGVAGRPFTLDIVAKHGDLVLARKKVADRMPSDDDILARVDFEVAEAVHDLEVRILVDQGGDVKVNGYRIDYR